MADNKKSDNKKQVNYFNLYQDVWNFHKKYAEIQRNDFEYSSSDKYWDELVEEAGSIGKKYEEDKFAVQMIVSVCDELDRSFRKKRDQRTSESEGSIGNAAKPA